MTRKDYVAIAGAIKETPHRKHAGLDMIFKGDLLLNLASIFEQDNPLFDREKFFRACQHDT